MTRRVPARCHRPPPLMPMRRPRPVSLAKVAVRVAPVAKAAEAAVPVKAAAASSSPARRRSRTKPLPVRIRRPLRWQAIPRQIARLACPQRMASLPPKLLLSPRTKTFGPKAQRTQATKAMMRQATSVAARVAVGGGVAAEVPRATAKCRPMPAAKSGPSSPTRQTASLARRFRHCPTRHQNPSPSALTCQRSPHRARSKRSRLRRP